MMTSNKEISRDEREDNIQALEWALKTEGLRIVHAGEKKLSDKYNETAIALTQAKGEYERIVGAPYTAASNGNKFYTSMFNGSRRTFDQSTEELKGEDDFAPKPRSKSHS